MRGNFVADGRITASAPRIDVAAIVASYEIAARLSAPMIPQKRRPKRAGANTAGVERYKIAFRDQLRDS